MELRTEELSFDNITIQNYLQEAAKKYLTIIKSEYGTFMSPEQIQFLGQLLTSDCIKVDLNGKEYLANQTTDINNSNMTASEKDQEIEKLSIPLAHGGRVFDDNKIHFYPSVLLAKNPNSSTDELKQKCEEVLIHELLHFFIRPQSLDTTNTPQLKGINSFTTEGLVDMCARDIQQKYDLFPNYNSGYSSNVIFLREALSNIPNLSDRMQLVFNGSVDQIYLQTSSQEYNSYQNFISAREKQTEFDQVIMNVSRICYPEQKRTESCRRFLYNFAANFKSKNEALEAIEKQSQQQFGDKISLIQQATMAYKNNAETKDVSTEKQQKTLVKTNSNSSASNKGYINITILVIIISIVTILLTIIIYSILN